MKTKVIIKEILPGLNDIINKCKHDKYKGAKLLKESKEICEYYFREQCNKVFTKPLLFTFKWYEKTKRRDKDNICSAVKLIFDGMQQAGVLKNDGWKQIENWTNEFYVDKNYPRVEITIKELD